MPSIFALGPILVAIDQHGKQIPTSRVCIPCEVLCLDDDAYQTHLQSPNHKLMNHDNVSETIMCAEPNCDRAFFR